MNHFFKTIGVLCCLLVFGAVTVNAQCTTYNHNLNFKSQNNFTSNPIFCKNGDYIIAVWSPDSFMLNKQKLKKLFTSPNNNCNLLKFKSDGTLIQQINLNIPYTIYTVNFVLDASDNLYFPLVVGLNTSYWINSSINIPSKNYSSYGIVKVSNDFSKVNYSEIGKTELNANAFVGSLLFCNSNGGFQGTVSISSKVTLNSGEVISNKSINSLYLIHLDTALICDKPAAIICNSVNSIQNLGLETVGKSTLAIIQYTDSIRFPSLNKLQLAVMKSVYKLPYDGMDFAIMDVSNGKLNSSYNIGCPGNTYFLSPGKKFYSYKNYYLTCINSASNGIFDNLNKSYSCKTFESNAVLVFDSLFNLISYQAIESTAKNGYSFLNLFNSTSNNLLLNVGTNKWYNFQSKLSTVPDTVKSNTFLTKIYGFNSNQFTEIYSHFDTSFRFQTFDYSSNRLFGYFVKLNNPSDTLFHTPMAKGNFPNYLWIANFCSDKLNNYQYKTGNNEDFQIFPNPIAAGNTVNLNFKSQSMHVNYVEVFDVTGKLIERIHIAPNLKSIEFALKNRGIYFIKPNWYSGTYKLLVE